MVKYFPDDFEQVGKILLLCLGTSLGDDLSSTTVDDNGILKHIKILGFHSPISQQARIKILASEVIFGSALKFTLSLDSDASQEQAMTIYFIICHRKANGKTSPKVFK